MGGTGTPVSGGNGSSSITWTYDGVGLWTVKLTVTGLNGVSSDTAQTQVDVTGP